MSRQRSVLECSISWATPSWLAPLLHRATMCRRFFCVFDLFAAAGDFIVRNWDERKFAFRGSFGGGSDRKRWWTEAEQIRPWGAATRNRARHDLKNCSGYLHRAKQFCYSICMTTMQNVLVTGGAGYLGSRVTAHLLQAGYAVTVFDKLVYGGEALLPFNRHERFKLIRGDVRDGEPSLPRSRATTPSCILPASSASRPARSIPSNPGRSMWRVESRAGRRARGKNRAIHLRQHLQQLRRGQARRTRHRGFAAQSVIRLRARQGRMREAASWPRRRRPPARCCVSARSADCRGGCGSICS